MVSNQFTRPDSLGPLGGFALWGQGAGLKPRLFEILLGALAALGFAPFYLAPITLICTALIGIRLYALHRSGAGFKAGFKTGWFFGFGLFLAGLYWIGSAFTMRPGGYIYLMAPMVGGLIAGLSLFWGLAAGLAVRGRALTISGFGLKLVCLLFLAEVARGHLWGGLPWNLPGYIIKAGHPLSQISSLVGIYGQSLLVLLLAAALMVILAAPNRRPIMLSIAASVLGLAGFWIYGHMRLPTAPQGTHPDVKLRLVMVDFSQRDQFDSDKSVAIVREFLRQSISPGFEDVTHVIWPEGAVGGLVLENEGLVRAAGETFVGADPQSPPSWVLNTLRYEQRRAQDGTPRNVYYNSMAEMRFDRSANPRLVGFNDKTRLVPFGEFIPFTNLFEKIGLGTLSANLASMTPGDEKTSFNLSGLPEVNSLICYEGIFPDVSQNIKGDPKWILNLSNDGWYGRLTGPYQHANQTRYRAIETGLPLVRVSSGGESGVYDAYGRPIISAPSRVTRVLDVALPNHRVKTYQQSQNVLYIVLISAFILLIANFMKADVFFPQRSPGDIGVKH